MLNCAREETNKSSTSDGDVQSAGVLFPASLERRQKEVPPNISPKQKVSSWYIEDTNYYLSDDRYLAQNVLWDDMNNLQAGNVTEKRIGSTARWLMVTDSSVDDDVKNLWSRHKEESGNAYSNSLSGVARVEQKCDQAASDVDIFVLCLGVAASIAGGVDAFLRKVHNMLRWIVLQKRQGTIAPVVGCRKILPTYELGLTIMGALVFLGLYIPFVLQIVTEFEIYNYREILSGMHVQNSESLESKHEFAGQASLVTLAYTETWCSEARPFLLLLIMGTGFLLAVLVNMPHVHMSFLVLSRYLKRLFGHGDENGLPAGCTIADPELRILAPHRFLFQPDRQYRDNRIIFRRAETSSLLQLQPP
mmetsp:Transcript_24996/g.51960  ORF Transcript_24996/g.51960 Transcript_24996/m.51960 type:complete len:362 (-) Transcript_24996:430-1515(-)